MLENLLAHSPVNGPSDEEMIAFLSQFNENYLPTKDIVDQYLSQFKHEPATWPMMALITFTDQSVTSRVVTSQLGELIGRMRSVSVQDPGACTGVALRALNDALENLTDHGHLILVTSSSAEQALDAEMQAKLQARDIRVHIFFTGSCEEKVDKTVYQEIANVSGGSFHWLPQGITPEAEITMKLSQVITPLMMPSMPAACLLYGVQDEALNNSIFFSYDPNENLVKKLGEVCLGCDIESLAIHPLTNEIYVGSGDNAVGHSQGHLYKLDPTTGGLHSVGDTGFSGISSLAFDSEGRLWSWGKGQGLATLNVDTG